MPTILKLANEAERELRRRGFELHRLDAFTSDSVYLKLDCGLVGTLRISDHRPKRHLEFRYNVGPYVARAHRTLDGAREIWWFPPGALNRMVRIACHDRGRKVARYGGEEAYLRAMRRAEDEGRLKVTGFWSRCWKVK